MKKHSKDSNQKEVSFEKCAEQTIACSPQIGDVSRQGNADIVAESLPPILNVDVEPASDRRSQLRNRLRFPGYLHTVTSQFGDKYFQPAGSLDVKGVLQLTNASDFIVAGSILKYAARTDLPAKPKDLRIDPHYPQITPDKLMLIRYIYSLARETRLRNMREDHIMVVNGRELEVFTGISMRGSFHGRSWDERFSDFSDLVVYFEDGLVYRIVDYLGTNLCKDEFQFNVTFFDLLDDYLAKKHRSRRGYVRPHHARLIHSNARVVRDNPLALFLVEILLSGVLRRGSLQSPNQDSDDNRVTYRATYEFCINRVPHIRSKIQAYKSAKETNKLLLRLKEAAELIILQMSDAQEYFNDFKLDLSKTSSMSLDKKIIITHRGVNRASDYSES